MSTLWAFLHWFSDNWLLIPWGASVIVAYIYGGKRLALIVATLGLGAFAYRKGIQHGREYRDERTAKVEKRRENAFKEIDNRGTNRDDVLERLRQNDY
jgi:hypothetical protein